MYNKTFTVDSYLTAINKLSTESNNILEISGTIMHALILPVFEGNYIVTIYYSVPL